VNNRINNKRHIIGGTFILPVTASSITTALALAFGMFVLSANYARADHHKMDEAQQKAQQEGCIKQPDGGFVCKYVLPQGYDAAAADEPQRKKIFEGCLSSLYDSCRAQGGGRHCGWTAKLSCRSLNQPHNAG